MKMFSPFLLKERQLLTKPGSCKQTFHLVLNPISSIPSFKVGDSLAIHPQNAPDLVHGLLRHLAATGEERIKDPRSDALLSLREFLLHKANLSKVSASLLSLLMQTQPSHEKRQQLSALLQQDNKTLLRSLDLLDMCSSFYSPSCPLQALCEAMLPLLPRFYSIASSPLAYPQEIHLLVALASFNHQGQLRHGVASYFLCSLAQVQKTSLLCQLQPTPYFTLPENSATPIILIGAGTGIAPFRAFLQERILKQATGDHWLFFGECNRATDYFYEQEWERWKAAGRLRLNLAFSRDQQEKIYVQHLLWEERRDLWRWLEEGASIYVCGSAHPMAQDVHQMLIRIVQEEGRMQEEQAREHLRQLRHNRRYLTEAY